MTETVSRTNAPARASVAVGLLLGVALAGCVGTLPGPLGPETGGGAGEADEAGEGSPQDGPHGPSLDASVRVTGPTAVDVSFDISGRLPNATLLVTYVPEGLDDRARVVEPPSSSDTVALDDLSSDQSYRIHFQVAETDRDRLDAETLAVRTPPRSWAVEGDALVQPGIPIDGGCTLAFVLTSAVNASVYGVTAGHCLNDRGVGAPVHHDNERGPKIGTVAAYEHWRTVDWGLIRLDADVLNRTSPAVKGNGGPTGLADASSYRRDDVLCTRGHSVYSLPRDWAGSYERPCGLFADHIPGNSSRDPCDPVGRECLWSNETEALDWFTWYGPVAWGDSGGPVIHAESGRAVGINTQIHWPAIDGSDGTALGPTLASVLDRAKTFGYHLRLATAPHDGNGSPTP